MKEVQNATVTDDEIAILMRVLRRFAVRRAAAARRARRRAESDGDRAWLRDIELRYGPTLESYRRMVHAASS